MFKRRVTLAILFSILGLGGCTTTSQGFGQAQPYTTFGADEFSDHTIKAWKQYAKIAKEINGAEGVTALQNATLYSQYRISGVAYVDRKCGEYFQALHVLHRKKRELANTSNILVGGITAIMGA